MNSTSRKTHWLDIAETSAMVVSLGGSVTSIVLKQFLWATVPLSVSAGLAVVNHQRLRRLVKSEQEAVAFLVRENKARISKLKEQSEQAHWESKVGISELKQSQDEANEELERIDRVQKTKLEGATKDLETLQTSVAKLDKLTRQLEQEQNETRKLAKELKTIEKYTQEIANNDNLVQSYYQRGLAYQRTGNIERAIDDFTKVIELQSDHVKAYHQRGLLYSEIGEAQKAIIDLRRASQYYIGKGDLDKYRETRDLSLKIHLSNSTEARENETHKVSPKIQESVMVGNLFG